MMVDPNTFSEPTRLLLVDWEWIPGKIKRFSCAL